jgi:DHA2 family multidrug resistance protein-like MFS transporter
VGFATLIIGFALFNLGAGPLTTLGTGIIISSVEPPKAGSAAAISQTSNEFGFALGVAIVGSIGTFVYQTQTAATLPLLTGLSASDAQAVRESLASAVDKAGDLPNQLGRQMLYLARKAFVEEYHTASLVSAVVMAVVAVVIVTRLKGIRADREDVAE